MGEGAASSRLIMLTLCCLSACRSISQRPVRTTHIYSLFKEYISYNLFLFHFGYVYLDFWHVIVLFNKPVHIQIPWEAVCRQNNEFFIVQNLFGHTVHCKFIYLAVSIRVPAAEWLRERTSVIFEYILQSAATVQHYFGV